MVFLGFSIWLFNLALLLGIAQFFIALPEVHWLLVVSLALKMLVEYLFIAPLCRFANRSELLWQLPLLSIVHALYLVYIGLAGNIGKYDWKGRTVK